MTLIWALDIATVTGFALGIPGEKPVASSVRFGLKGSDRDSVFQSCLIWFSGLLERGPPPDLLMIEELLPPIARRGTTSTAAQHRLAGLHGIVRALARQAQIPQIASASPSDVRGHFINQRSLPRDSAKKRVAAMCRAQGWIVDDNDCADALALWSYGCALIKPDTALKLTPLFGRSSMLLRG